MGQNDKAVERHERLKHERLSKAVNRVNDAKGFYAARGDGVMTTSGDVSINEMMQNADIEASPELNEQDTEDFGQGAYEEVLDEASEAFDYLGEGEFVDEKVETFMMYDEVSGLYEVTEALTSDEDMLATAGQIFEWTQEMESEYDLLEDVEGGGLEYTEKGQQVYNFLDSQT